jgi:hypothetical protein
MVCFARWLVLQFILPGFLDETNSFVFQKNGGGSKKPVESP